MPPKSQSAGARRDAANAAQTLVYDAWEIPDRAKRIELAQTALRIYPDCADALSVLADAEYLPFKKLDLYEQALAAARRTLGEAYFENEDNVGEFYHLLETRPYLRACHGVAYASWRVGDRKRAIELCDDVLRLNRSDNLGLRYTLGMLLVEEQSEAARRELQELVTSSRSYEPKETTWYYLLSLALYQETGSPTEAARAELIHGFRANRFVPDLLIGDAPLPINPSEGYAAGDSNEAADLALLTRNAWLQTSGALVWLRAEWEKFRKRSRARSTDSRSLGRR